jgi:hypothetical protein
LCIPKKKQAVGKKKTCVFATIFKADFKCNKNAGAIRISNVLHFLSQSTQASVRWAAAPMVALRL